MSSSVAMPGAPPVAPPGERPRFLSEADCRDIAQRLARFAKGGGSTTVTLWSTWRGNVRWARNELSTSGDVQDNVIWIQRNLDGAMNDLTWSNDLSDAGLLAATRRAERMAQFRRERPQNDLVSRYSPEPLTMPNLFSETTYQLDADRRSDLANQLIQSARDAGMLSAGYIEVSAHSLALLDSYGHVWYYPFTQAQYSVTVRDPKGTGSGWAGVDWFDWAKIDGPGLSTTALDKCLTSRNPVAIEPGRYTTILEPQAVCDFVAYLVQIPLGSRAANEQNRGDVFNKSPGFSRLGEKIIDERITISADPADPELGFPPFNLDADGVVGFAKDVYHPVTWIDHGVLAHLGTSREYAIDLLHENLGSPDSGAFRMSGGNTSMEEMIATTKRGLCVTRFDNVTPSYNASTMVRANTRDGLWLVENGKISKPVKNMVCTESILFALNNVEQLGVPQRVFHPPQPFFLMQPAPVIVPPLKIRDFSFTALDDAV